MSLQKSDADRRQRLHGSVDLILHQQALSTLAQLAIFSAMVYISRFLTKLSTLQGHCYFCVCLGTSNTNG